MNCHFLLPLYRKIMDFGMNMHQYSLRRSEMYQLVVSANFKYLSHIEVMIFGIFHL